jgi:hypothetical protein
MRQIRFYAFAVAAAMALVSLCFRSLHITLSVIGGSAAVILSFELLGFVVSRAIGKSKKLSAALVLVAVFKLLLLGVVLWFAVTRLPVNALAFLAGLSTIVCAVAVSTVVDLLRGTERETN